MIFRKEETKNHREYGEKNIEIYRRNKLTTEDTERGKINLKRKSRILRNCFNRIVRICGI